jgi:ABC-type branched-subunit amino acid transport system substrate-binding protein
MFPTSGSKAEVGTVCERGADLARRDFVQIAHGLPPRMTGGASRPLGIIACNDADRSEQPAQHLANDAGVSAVMGFSSSQEVIDLATKVFLPRGILVVASQNPSTLITSIPHPPNVPRLVYRTALSAAVYQVPVGLVVPGLLEPQLREAKIVGPNAAMRVAFVRSNTTAALTIADQLFGDLRFNGKSALENGEKSYRQFVFEDGEHTRDVVAGIVDFRPHVIIFSADGDLTLTVLEPIEKAWRSDMRYRPFFLSTASLTGSDLFRFIGSDAGRRHRFFGVAPPATTMANARLTMRYNEIFRDHVTADASPGAQYDAFYLLAYAAFASGTDHPSGVELAGGIAKLVPPGAQIDVGPTRILEAIETLRTAERFDLGGIMTRLDFDLKTGESKGDLTITCVGVDDSGRASRAIDSGLRYDSGSGKLVGTLRCP